MGKKMVCLCEDVTEDEIVEAIKAGFDEIELLKRLTGISTGPCQGKFCLPHVLRILARAKKKSIEEMQSTPSRSPARPTLIGTLAGEKAR